MSSIAVTSFYQSNPDPWNLETSACEAENMHTFWTRWSKRRFPNEA